MKILTKSSHRNGICGNPFDVYLFEDEDGSIKLAIDFGEMSFAVLQIDRLSKGDIAFGSNSWRGDYYSSLVRELKNTVEDQVADGAFFIKHT